MITTRTRILSILATVAMLVSMLACFVIPASADESVTAPYQALIEDVGADKVPYLAAVIETATDDATLAAELAKDVAAGTIVWPTWAYGEADYPRYAYKAVYDAAGYNSTENANVWSISAPADWTAMVAASTHDTANPDATETFAGYTFHVTQDIDFEDVDMYPLSLGDGKYYAAPGAFQGTIQGHNHAFKRISVIDPLTTTTGNRTIGMIGKLGRGAVIENFGVDSGKIVASTTCSRSSVSTFGVGCPGKASEYDGDVAVLHNVWSGVDITVSGGSTGNYAGGILGISADTNGLVTINGAYFDGTLSAGSATYGILYNIRTGAVYNALSNLNAVKAISLQSSATASMFKNIYSVGADPVYLGSNTAVTEANITENKCGNAASVEVGAWELNKLQTTSPVSGVDPVYYTWVTNSLGVKAIRPTGTEANRIVKVTVGDVTDPLYVNLDTTELTRDYLVQLTENEAITGYSLDGGTTPVLFDETNTHVVLPGDEATITLEVNAEGELEEIKTKYSNLLAYSDYLTDEAIAAIGTFVANATVATLESDEATLLSALKTYSTYPAEGDKKVPGYKEVETLGAYNEANVWTINSTEDWLKMVADSKCESETELGKTFENHIFYVTRDINFEGITMKPLNFGSAGGKDNDSTCPFQGTINGNGYAFKNITVEEEVDSTSNTSVGMIGKLGNKARINNFGVDSGDIVITSVEGYEKALYVSTFGDPVTKEATCRLNKVWSGATIKADSTGTNHAAGIMARGRDSAVIINGAYFFGTLEATNMYGVFIDMKAGEAVYNSLSASKTTGTAMILHSVTGTAINNANVGSDPISTADGATGTVEKNVNATSALEGAWTINSNQPAADGVAEVFYTRKENGDIRFGDETNKIVKVSVNNDEKAIYVNNGTTLNKAAFADLYEVGANAIIINDDASTAEVTANGDTAVAITVDYAAELANVRDKYDELDAMYLTDAAADALNTFLTSTEDAQAVLATEGDLITALTGGVYTTYPAEGGKAVPGYKDVETYGKYNTAHVWTINEAEDWTDMVRDSVSNNFTDYVFHVTDNIDFEDQPMLPLNYGDNAKVDDATYRFNGTINGYGNAFKNINVLVEGLDTSKTNSHIAVGMIGKLGNKARINNFGVDSGSITVTGKIYESRTLYVSTFGEALHYENGTSVSSSYVDDHAELNNVWSGATITAGATTGSNMAAGLMAHSLYSYVSINGGYFFGTLSPAEGSFGITSHARQTTVNNVLSDSATAEAMFTSHAAVTAANNVYATGSTTIDATTFAITNYGNVSSALEGAWTINSKQSAEDANAVYFTLKENGDIRFGEEANRIVKVTVNNEPEYVNVGTTLDKAYFVDLFGVSEAAITSIKVGEEDHTDTGVAAADDLVVTVELDVNGTYQKQLTDKLAEYDLENLNLDYFKTADELEAGKIGLKAFVEMARTAIETQTGLAEAVAQISNVVAEIKGADDYENLPAYKDHALYEEYQPEGDANWLIADKADWDAMDAFANAQSTAGNYFENTIFHLKEDVDFEENNMYPLGIRTENMMTFAGTIDGHGYGFKNVYINTQENVLDDTYFATEDTRINESIGLIGFLGNGCTIQNFGVNSGTIYGYTGRAGVSVSTFGTIPENATVNFTKVWSGATLKGASNPFITPLAGLDTFYSSEGTSYSATSKAIVNGFTFYGETLKNTGNYNIVYGIMGGLSSAPAEGSSFANIITYPTTQADRNTYLFGAGLADLSGYTISNVYGIKKADATAEGVGFVYDYRTSTGSGEFDGNTTENEWVKDTTPEAAAWTINNANTGADGDVYFKLVDGGIRPTGDATNKIVMVDVTVGETTETKYINANQSYTNTELRDALGYGVETTITNVEVTSGGEYAEGVLTVNGDAVITVTIDVCEHPEFECAYNGDEETHTFTCTGCGYTEIGDCTKAWVAGEINADGTSVHKATCPDCKHEYEEACSGGTKEQNVDCTEDDTWVFTCGVHADRVVAEGSHETGHDFENGEGWKQDEVDVNKQYRQCGHEGCEVKEYKLLGEASATGVELYCKENDTITITLPDYLASADLTFSFEGTGYTITHVNGTEWNGGVYAVTAGGEVTVTIAADVTAVGGTFKVEVANAKDAEDTPIEFAGATATIGFTPTPGDANGDKTVNLADALAALYKVAQKLGAADINEANADIDGTEGFTINDVYAIVREWLKTTLGE